MDIFSCITGYGRNSDVFWVAAESSEQAQNIASSHGHKIRKVHKARPVEKTDLIEGPGPILFCGFGLKGPAQTWHALHKQ